MRVGSEPAQNIALQRTKQSSWESIKRQGWTSIFKAFQNILEFLQNLQNVLEYSYESFRTFWKRRSEVGQNVSQYAPTLAMCQLECAIISQIAPRSVNAIIPIQNQLSP